MDDTKNTLTGELRSVGGSRSVSKVSPVGANAANTVTERSVREMQIIVRTIVAYIEWVYGATSDPGGAISTWTMEIVGHVVSRSQSSVLDVRTACERRRLRTCPKALVQFNELERLLNRQPKDKGKTQNCTDPTRYLVDRFDGVVVGTTGRVLRARIVCRMAEEQRGDARGTKSVRWVPWQQTSPRELKVIW